MNNSGNKSKCVVTYFHGNGRAAVIRAILYSQKVEFEDKKLQFEEWGQVKKSGNFEFEQIPQLDCVLCSNSCD